MKTTPIDFSFCWFLVSGRRLRCVVLRIWPLSCCLVISYRWGWKRRAHLMLGRDVRAERCLPRVLAWLSGGRGLAAFMLANRVWKLCSAMIGSSYASGAGIARICRELLMGRVSPFACFVWWWRFQNIDFQALFWSNCYNLCRTCCLEHFDPNQEACHQRASCSSIWAQYFVNFWFEVS